MPRKGVSARGEDVERFERWYSVYPRKVNRGQAVVAWRALAPDDALIGEMIDAVRAQLRWRSAAVQGGKWVPDWPHPASWLRGQRWLDQRDEDATSAAADPAHAARVCGKPGCGRLGEARVGSGWVCEQHYLSDVCGEHVRFLQAELDRRVGRARGETPLQQARRVVRTMVGHPMIPENATQQLEAAIARERTMPRLRRIDEDA